MKSCQADHHMFVGTFLVGGLCSFATVGLVGGGVVGHKMRKHREQRNFAFAHQNGVLDDFAKRWNKDYFEALGLQVRVEAPNSSGRSNMEDMDVTSTKLFKYQEKNGISSADPGTAASKSDKKAQHYQIKEGRYRVKAARRHVFPTMSYSPY